MQVQLSINFSEIFTFNRVVMIYLLLPEGNVQAELGVQVHQGNLQGEGRSWNIDSGS